MSVLEFFLGKSILGLNFPLFYLIFSTEFSTPPHPDTKLILGHCEIHVGPGAKTCGEENERNVSGAQNGRNKNGNKFSNDFAKKEKRTFKNKE